MLTATRLPRAAAVIMIAACAAVPATAADKWIEVKSAHVTVVSSASGSSTRTLAWQLEQMRLAITKLWPWARVDLDRPLLVVAVDDEPGMRSLAPRYFQRGGIRPHSIWVGGADRYYLAIRADQQAEDNAYTNPHVSAYFSYASLVLDRSVPVDLPEWFSRGVAGVLSNTIVRQNQILLGPPIPWHLETLRERTRLTLPALLAVTRKSPEMASGEGLGRFDAQAWAFVHFLMFSNNGARAGRLNQFFKLVSDGMEGDVAFREVFGSAQALEADFVAYISRNIFGFQQHTVDLSVKREAFAERTLSPAEAAGVRALFHVAMQDPAAARTEAARAREGQASDADVAEALLLDREGKRDEAAAAFAKAVAAESNSAYAHYRLATLRWMPTPDEATLADVEKLLARAVARNPGHAGAYAFLAEVRSLRGSGEPIGLIGRAIQLEPTDANHRLIAASILWRRKEHANALKAIQTALALSTTDEQRQRARQLQEAVEKDK